jgi:dihydroceramidase
MQLVDELSMIYTTCLMCYATFSHARSLLSRSLLGIFLSLLCIFITLYYHYLQDPAFHEAVYGILTVVVVVRAVYVMEVNLRPRFRSRSEDGSGIGKVDSEDRKKERQREDAKNREILTQMWTMIRYGLSAFLLGFLLWTVDIQYCPTLRQWRRSIGMPWGFFLELHGWWYVFILLSIFAPPFPYTIYICLFLPLTPPLTLPLSLLSSHPLLSSSLTHSSHPQL